MLCFTISPSDIVKVLDASLNRCEEGCAHRFHADQVVCDTGRADSVTGM
jgi:hypothetical protein